MFIAHCVFVSSSVDIRSLGTQIISSCAHCCASHNLAGSLWCLSFLFAASVVQYTFSLYLVYICSFLTRFVLYFPLFVRRATRSYADSQQRAASFSRGWGCREEIQFYHIFVGTFQNLGVFFEQQICCFLLFMSGTGLRSLVSAGIMRWCSRAFPHIDCFHKLRHIGFFCCGFQ